MNGNEHRRMISPVRRILARCSAAAKAAGGLTSATTRGAMTLSHSATNAWKEGYSGSISRVSWLRQWTGSSFGSRVQYCNVSPLAP